MALVQLLKNSNKIWALFAGHQGKFCCAQWIALQVSTFGCSALHAAIGSCLTPASERRDWLGLGSLLLPKFSWLPLWGSSAIGTWPAGHCLWYNCMPMLAAWWLLLNFGIAGVCNYYTQQAWHIFSYSASSDLRLAGWVVHATAAAGKAQQLERATLDPVNDWV